MKNKKELHNTFVDITDTLGQFSEDMHESNAEIADREEVLNDIVKRKKQIPEDDPMYFWDRVKQNKAKFDW
jgi:uncharacterized coiled-coil DUF342 family protein